MKILIVGAGPAGLSFAALMLEADRSHSITILERNPAERTPGWGITLRDHALSFLRLDPRLATQSLDGRALRYRGELTIDLPNPPGVCLVTFPRAALIAALADACCDRGVHVTFGVDAALLSENDLAGYDLVVASDGAHSAIRHRYAVMFKPAVMQGRNRYAWLGAATPFDKLTILLTDESAPLLAWAYKYTSDRSTFIVECTEQTYERSGLGGRSAHDACAMIDDAFAPVLQGQPVLAGRSIQWQSYRTISCEKLTYRNIVLLGDAAHTTHFSQGFGTMFAFDDALSLQTAFESGRDVAEALATYESMQRPKVAEFQATAAISMQWSERLLESAENRNEALTRELIAARWPHNEVTASPLGRGSRTTRCKLH